MSCELEIYRLKSGDDNSFLRGFDLIYTILLFTFNPNVMSEVLTSFETRNYDQ